MDKIANPHFSVRFRKTSQLALARSSSIQQSDEGRSLLKRGSSAINVPFGVEGSIACPPMLNGTDVEAQLPSAPKQRRATIAGVLTSSIVYDWLAALACLILALGLEKAKPRHVYVLEETLYLHSYPHKDNTVPSWTVPVYGLLGPLVLLFVSSRFVARRPWIELARLWAALALAFFMTGAITNCLKLPVGRLRPNFVKTCWPNGTLVFQNRDQWGGYAVCDPRVSEGDAEEIRKSWPSGHSSLSAAGLGFTTYYLLGQLRPFSAAACEGRLWRLTVALLPSFGAVAVAVTRVLDYWHFTSDALTGLAIGFITAFVVYQAMYPPLTHPRCDLPRDVLAAAERGGGAAGAGAATGSWLGGDFPVPAHKGQGVGAASS